MYKMTDEEFYEVYGRMPRRTQHKKKKVKVYWGRIIVAFIVLLLIILGIVKVIKLIAGKAKGGKTEENSVSVSSAAEKNEDYYAEPENKEKETVYEGIDLTVCIDAAHGGFDKGAVGDDGRLEKDDTLKIALAVKEHLENCGVKVIMTRTDDSFLAVEDRCRIANEQNADVFVSIHRSITEVAGSDIQGFEAWIHNSKPSADNAFAGNIMTKLQEMGISENKGVHAGYPEDSSVNYPVLEQTKMPAVLLDMGYVTNSIDNQLLDANLEAYARAIGNGVIETATDLGVVDKNGARVLSGQLTSDKPAPVVKEEKPVKKDESRPDDDSSSQAEDEDGNTNEWEDTEQEEQQVQPEEQEQQEESPDDYVYTDDGMAYYIEPMMTE